MLVNCEFVRMMNIHKNFVPVQYPCDKNYYFIPGFSYILISKDGSILRRNWRITNSIVFDPIYWKKVNNRYSAIVTEIYNNNYSKSTHKIQIKKAVLLAVMFLPKPSYFPECRIKFKDGNRNNETLENLEFSPLYSDSEKITKIKKELLKKLYTSPLKAFEDLPNFYYIPGFNKRYIINPRSFIMYFRKGQNHWIRKKWYIKHEGYASTKLMLNNAVGLYISRHQLLARMFLRDQITDDMDMNKIQIDHINEIPGDDRLDNLKIVTSVENVNNYFSKGNRRPTPKPVQVKNINTGKVIKYESVISCGKEYNLSRDQVLYRIDHPNKLFPENNLYRIWSKETENMPWPEINNTDKKSVDYKNRFIIQVRDCETGIITEYKSQSEFIIKQRELGYYIPDSSEVCSWFKQKNFIYRLGPNKYIQVKNKFDNKKFKKYKYYRDAYIRSKNNLTPIIRINPKTGEKVMFLTCQECANASGISLRDIKSHLARNKPEYVFPEGFQYRKYNSQLDFNMKFYDE